MEEEVESIRNDENNYSANATVESILLDDDNEEEIEDEPFQSENVEEFDNLSDSEDERDNDDESTSTITNVTSLNNRLGALLQPSDRSTSINCFDEKVAAINITEASKEFLAWLQEPACTEIERLVSNNKRKSTLPY